MLELLKSMGILFLFLVLTMLNILSIVIIVESIKVILSKRNDKSDK